MCVGSSVAEEGKGGLPLGQNMPRCAIRFEISALSPISESTHAHSLWNRLSCIIFRRPVSADIHFDKCPRFSPVSRRIDKYRLECVGGDLRRDLILFRLAGLDSRITYSCARWPRRCKLLYIIYTPGIMTFSQRLKYIENSRQ